MAFYNYFYIQYHLTQASSMIPMRSHLPAETEKSSWQICSRESERLVIRNPDPQHSLVPPSCLEDCLLRGSTALPGGLVVPGLGGGWAGVEERLRELEAPAAAFLPCRQLGCEQQTFFWKTAVFTYDTQRWSNVKDFSGTILISNVLLCF